MSESTNISTSAESASPGERAPRVPSASLDLPAFLFLGGIFIGPKFLCSLSFSSLAFDGRDNDVTRYCFSGRGVELQPFCFAVAVHSGRHQVAPRWPFKLQWQRPRPRGLVPETKKNKPTKDYGRLKKKKKHYFFLLAQKKNAVFQTTRGKKSTKHTLLN